MLKVLAVGCGGFVGSALRYGLVLLTPASMVFPIMTLTVNIVGSFVIGCFGQYLSINENISQYWVLFVQVGLCGGFTTFSTFSLDIVKLADQNHMFMAGMYALLSVALCICATLLGIYIMKQVYS